MLCQVQSFLCKISTFIGQMTYVVTQKLQFQDVSARISSNSLAKKFNSFFPTVYIHTGLEENLLNFLLNILWVIIEQFI